MPKRRLIVYVEDNEVNAILMTSILSVVPNLDLVICTEGRKGIETIKNRKPNLVLLDMQLPDMSGFDVLKALHDDKLYPNVVAVSANAMERDIEIAIRHGVIDYWTKPLDVSHIMRRTVELLDKT